jgi:hypothetical protein
MRRRHASPCSGGCRHDLCPLSGCRKRSGVFEAGTSHRIPNPTHFVRKPVRVPCRWSSVLSEPRPTALPARLTAQNCAFYRDSFEYQRRSVRVCLGTLPQGLGGAAQRASQGGPRALLPGVLSSPTSQSDRVRWWPLTPLRPYERVERRNVPRNHVLTVGKVVMGKQTSVDCAVRNFSCRQFASDRWSR